MEAALRKRDANEFGPIRYVIAGVQGGYSPDGWMVYGQHPAWTVVTLLGAGARRSACTRARTRVTRW